MSMIRYKMTIHDREDYCFSVNNQEAYVLDRDLDLEYSSDYYEELFEENELEYDIAAGMPECHVLRWHTFDEKFADPAAVDPNRRDILVKPQRFGAKIAQQLKDMGQQKRTPWRLRNVTIGKQGNFKFDFDLACLSDAYKYDNHTDADYDVGVKEKISFTLILETRSSGFDRTKFRIERYRDTDRGETIFHVTERGGGRLCQMDFHFPDEGEAYVYVSDFRI